MFGALMGCGPSKLTEQKPYKPSQAFGREAGFRLGVQARSGLPLSYAPKLDWLAQTLKNRPIEHKPIGLFASPREYAFRRAGANVYFDWRYGLKDALNQDFSPSLIVLHSTEGEDESHAFAIFNRNTPQQYLGGAWTHFSVDAQGQIYQYSPLDRISKGQSGIDDQAVGIELVGNASLWGEHSDEEGLPTSTGSLITRWQAGQRAQLEAAADLVATLQKHFAIPPERVYSHEDIGKVALRRGLSPSFPDYNYLAGSIRDKVYLALLPDLGPGRKPDVWYGFLEPYDRKDPGRDVMREIYSLLSLVQGSGPQN
ncbi:MAG: N-acetylmuramoyl-L-alanine amidase [Candidatus Sericytochromatia bacterium]